jgi:hypothetical protein
LSVFSMPSPKSAWKAAGTPAGSKWSSGGNSGKFSFHTMPRARKRKCIRRSTDPNRDTYHIRAGTTFSTVISPKDPQRARAQRSVLQSRASRAAGLPSRATPSPVGAHALNEPGGTQEERMAASSPLSYDEDEDFVDGWR